MLLKSIEVKYYFNGPITYVLTCIFAWNFTEKV